jgi:V8-like Glu-specific endopeptidase
MITVEELIAALLKGEYPEATANLWDEAVRLLASRAATAERRGVRNAAGALNKGRLFKLTVDLGNAWTQAHHADAVVLKHQGQALVNLSALDAAQALLEQGLRLASAPDADAAVVAEIAEFKGLLARIAKQRYVQSNDPGDLKKAIAQYLATDGSWPAINAVALMMRDSRDSKSAAAGAAGVELARSVRKDVLKNLKQHPNAYWLYSTLSEAFLAIGKADDAELWLFRFLGHPSVTPFAIDSYDRQLREIWQGSSITPSNPPADRLVAVIARYLRKTELRISFSADDIHKINAESKADPGFEKRFSEERGLGVGAVRSMLEACEAVGCVSDNIGKRLGTGFLVEGSKLCEAFGAGPVFVTNAHVVSESYEKAIRPVTARVTFETDPLVEDDLPKYKLGTLLFTSGVGDPGICCADDADLDVTIVRLQGIAPNHKVLKLAANVPVLDGKTKVYVIGHPEGGGLEISLTDSTLLDIDDTQRLMHYRTPTDPGSSGSPVFNTMWQVVALHHAGTDTMPRFRGGGFHKANEGIAFNAIRRKLKSVQADAAGQAPDEPGAKSSAMSLANLTRP